MLKKLINGEYALREAFWIFGFLGLPITAFITKILGKMLARKLNNYSILAYFLSPQRHGIEFSTTILTVLYLSIAGFLLFYCTALLLGTWRSSAEYDRSLWFRYLSRIFMVIMVLISIKFTFNL